MDTAFIDRVAFVEIKDRKVLLALSKHKDAWFIPGGKREKGETDEEALIREIKEEMSVDISPESITYFLTLEGKAYGKPEGTRVRIAFYTATYNGIVKPNAEIEKIEYFSFEDTPELPETGKILLNKLYIKGLIG